MSFLNSAGEFLIAFVWIYLCEWQSLTFLAWNFTKTWKIHKIVEFIHGKINPHKMKYFIAILPILFFLFFFLFMPGAWWLFVSASQRRKDYKHLHFIGGMKNLQTWLTLKWILFL